MIIGIALLLGYFLVGYLGWIFILTLSKREGWFAGSNDDGKTLGFLVFVCWPVFLTLFLVARVIIVLYRKADAISTSLSK